MTEQQKSIADSLRGKVTSYDESAGADVLRAARQVPVVDPAVKAGTSIAEHARQFANADGLDELAAASGALVSDGAKFVGGVAGQAVGFAFDPISWLVSHGLNMLLELVQPFQDALHAVSGDGPAIGHASENFTALAHGFVELANDFEKTGDETLKDWIDNGGRAARLALGDFSAGMRGAGSAAGSVADVLKMWSMVMVVIEEVIKAILAELVSFMITIWLPALATSVISWGSSVAAAMASTITKAATLFQKVSRHLGVFGRLLDEFVQFMAKGAHRVVALANRFRVGAKVEKGKKPLFVLGEPLDVDKFVPGKRIVDVGLGTTFGTAGRLASGVGIKSGIAAGKGLGKKAGEEYESDGPVFDKQDVGGGASAEETRKNLDM